MRRLVTRLNFFSAPSLEARRSLTAYWDETALTMRRLQFWRLNPVKFSWNAARDLKNIIVFFTSLATERY